MHKLIYYLSISIACASGILCFPIIPGALLVMLDFIIVLLMKPALDINKKIIICVGAWCVRACVCAGV